MIDKKEYLLNDEELDKISGGTIDEDTAEAIKLSVFVAYVANKNVTVHQCYMDIIKKLDNGTFAKKTEYSGSPDDRAAVWNLIQSTHDTIKEIEKEMNNRQS